MRAFKSFYNWLRCLRWLQRFQWVPLTFDSAMTLTPLSYDSAVSMISLRFNSAVPSIRLSHDSAASSAIWNSNLGVMTQRRHRRFETRISASWLSGVIGDLKLESRRHRRFETRISASWLSGVIGDLKLASRRHRRFETRISANSPPFSKILWAWISGLAGDETKKSGVWNLVKLSLELVEPVRTFAPSLILTLRVKEL